MLADWAESMRKEALVTQNWDFEGGTANNLHQGFDFESEIIFSLSPRFEIGFSSGFIYSELTEEDVTLTIKKNAVTTVQVRPAKITALPLSISGYYLFPIGNKFSFYLKGGGGLIWAKWVDREGSKKLEDNKFSYSLSQAAEAQNPIYFGGLGLKSAADPNLGFFVEATVRTSKAWEFQGDSKTGEKGDQDGKPESKMRQL